MVAALCGFTFSESFATVNKQWCNSVTAILFFLWRKCLPPWLQELVLLLSLLWYSDNLLFDGADMSEIPILLVGDRPDSTLNAGSFAGQTGLKIHTVENGAEAVAKVADIDFGLIVIEYNDWRGHLRVLSEISAHLEGRHLPPVLFVMATAPDEPVVLAEEPRILVDYVIKPVHAGLIRRKIAMLVEFGLRERQLAAKDKELDERNLELEVLRNELAEKNEMLEAVSARDDLTGLFSRRYFDDNLAKEWKQAVRSESSLALLIIDVDHFRKYNEEFGHMAGDDCLRQVGMALYEALLRPVDIIARYHGGVFATILPDTDHVGAEKVAVRMRANVAGLGLEQVFSPAAKRLTVTIGGIALVPQARVTPTRFFERAAQLLEQAKESGRNCCRIGQDLGI